MKFKFIILYAIFVALSSCKDENIQMVDCQKINDFWSTLTMPDYAGSLDFDTIALFDELGGNKAVSVVLEEKQTFKNGGYVTIGGIVMKTTIVGNQRWTTVDYKGFLYEAAFDSIENRIFGKRDTTIYYSYELAMTLNESETEDSDDEPDGLIELSKWRIPTLDDEYNFAYMLRKDYKAMAKGLKAKPYGLIAYWYKVPTYELGWFQYNKEYACHWVQGYKKMDAPYISDRYQMAFLNENHYMVGDLQRMNPYAPIRLVQDIEIEE